MFPSGGQQIDFNKQYLQSELPSDVFNSGNGDIKTFNGQQVKVFNNGNGTRSLQPLGAADYAQQLQDFQKAANAPAISTLQGQVDPLKQRYSDLLTSIKGQQQNAENLQQQATNAGLAARGILPDSQYGAQEAAAELRPITSQYQGLAAQTGVQEQNQLLDIAGQIAALQRGSPETSIQGATQIMGIQQQASNLAAELANARQIAQMQTQFRTLNPGQFLANLGNGQLMQAGGNTLGGLSNPFSNISVGGVPGGYNHSGSDYTSQLKALFGY